MTLRKGLSHGQRTLQKVPQSPQQPSKDQNVSSDDAWSMVSVLALLVFVLLHENSTVRNRYISCSVNTF